MNRFSLDRYRFLPAPGNRERLRPWDCAVPLIDGKPLFELLGDRHPGLGVSQVAPPSLQWLGHPSYVEEGRAVVLDGSCGVAGCCGVMARITLTEDVVTWDDFYALGPDLPAGLRFEFDRRQYERAIHQVIELEPTREIVDDVD